MDLETRLCRIGVREIELGERHRRDYGNVQELAESIKEQGLISPITVMELPEPTSSGCKYLLLAGGRRCKALALLGADSVDAKVYPPMTDEYDRKLIELLENTQRKDLDWNEEVALKQKIHEEMLKRHGKSSSTNPDGWNVDKTAKLFGEDRTAVQKDISLASAVAVMPALKASKNKHQAQKELNRAVENVANKELLRRAAARIQSEAKPPDAEATQPVDWQRKIIAERYIVSDFMSYARDIPANYFDFIELDPPYNLDCRTLTSSAEEDANLMASMQVSEDTYEKMMNDILAECYRIMKPNSWLILWYGIEPWHYLMLNGLRNNGFTTTGIPAIWFHDAMTTRQPQVRLGNCYDTFLYARKGSPVLARPGRSSVFYYRIVPHRRRIHPMEKPVELYQDLVETFSLPAAKCHSVFGGSGNFVLAAANVGREATCTDLSSDYKNGFTVRVFDTIPGKYNSLL
jgi:ParB-like chromosome segregation protein Spo0J